MNFGEALQALKDGRRVYRQGWNPETKFLYLVSGSTFKVNRPPLIQILGEGKEVEYNGHIDIMTPEGYVMPWTPSHNDLLAGDWQFVNDRMF